MKIVDGRVQELRLPLRRRFTHSLAARDAGASVLFRVQSAAGATGWGEGAPRDYVTGETLAGTAAALRTLAAHVAGVELPDVAAVAGLLDQLAPPPSARCAAELALLDALGRERGESVLHLLGAATVSEVRYSAILTASPGPALPALLAGIGGYGIREIKLKVGPDEAADTALIAELRAALGDVELRVDANGAWSLDEARARLPRLLKLGVVAVEQPLPVARRDDYPALCREFGGAIHLVIDESLCSLADARWFCEQGAATAFNLKVGKLGGLLGALAIHDLARRSGLRCQLGAHVGESSLLAAAGRILAALCGDLLWHEGSLAAFALERDVTATPLGFGPGGLGAVADLARTPGLGVTVSSDLG